ncbi:MAG: M20/M25/M40 family metallo-hydrolase [Aestuariivirgaceae bacterium]
MPRAVHELRSEICEWIDARSAEQTALLEKLVAAPSENPPGNVEAVARKIEDFLATRGLPTERIQRAENQPNIVSSIANGTGRHLILNGHMDTIPVGPRDRWTVEPFALTAQKDRLLGLGSGNMKGAVAALLFAFAWLAERTDLWQGKVTVTAVADEVFFGPNGAGFMLERRPDLLGDALICGEGPGAMGLAIAEKGVAWFRLKVRGEPGQGMAARRGDSAIHRLAAVITILDEWNERLVRAPGDLDRLDREAAREGLRISANVGKVSGGGFVSQLAAHAEAELDVRVPPGMTVETIERELKALVDTDWLTIERIKGWDPNWTPIDSEIVRSMESAAAFVRGAPPALVVRLPASDASRWRRAGIQAVCYGPQPLLASGVDDFVHRKDFLDCAKVYALAALDYLGGHRVSGS